jgi:hypothetical protein
MTKKQFIEKWQPGYIDTNGTHKSDEWMRDFMSLFEEEMQPPTLKKIEWSDLDRPDLKLIGSDIMLRFDVYFDPADEAHDRVTPENPPNKYVKFVHGNHYIQYEETWGWWLIFTEDQNKLRQIATIESIRDAVDLVLIIENAS